MLTYLNAFLTNFLMPSPSKAFIHVRVNGQILAVAPYTTVAAALALAKIQYSRSSVQGMPRVPFCGMGVCQECRVSINGLPHMLACMELCQPEMNISTEAS